MEAHELVYCLLVPTIFSHQHYGNEQAVSAAGDGQSSPTAVAIPVKDPLPAEIATGRSVHPSMKHVLGIRVQANVQAVDLQSPISLTGVVFSGSDLVDVILYGVKRQVLSVHPTMEYEALEAFYKVDEYGHGELPVDQGLKVIETLAHTSMTMNSDAAASYLQEQAKTILDKLVKDKHDQCLRMHHDGTTTCVVRFEDFLSVFRSLPLLYVPVQHDIQGIVAGQTITAVYRYLHLLDENQEWPNLTVSCYYSMSPRRAVMGVGHGLLQEVICKV